MSNKKITIKRINELAKEAGLTQVLMKEAYQSFMKTYKVEEGLDIETAFKAFISISYKCNWDYDAIIESSGINTEEEETKKKKNLTMERLVNKMQQVKKALVKYENQDFSKWERETNRRDRRKLNMISQKMDTKVREVISAYYSSLIVARGLIVDDEELHNKIEEKRKHYDKVWRDYARKEIIKHIDPKRINYVMSYFEEVLDKINEKREENND